MKQQAAEVSYIVWSLLKSGHQKASSRQSENSKISIADACTQINKVHTEQKAYTNNNIKAGIVSPRLVLNVLYIIIYIIIYKSETSVFSLFVVS